MVQLSLPRDEGRIVGMLRHPTGLRPPTLLEVLRDRLAAKHYSPLPRPLYQ